MHRTHPAHGHPGAPALDFSIHAPTNQNLPDEWCLWSCICAYGVWPACTIMFHDSWWGHYIFYFVFWTIFYFVFWMIFASSRKNRVCLVRMILKTHRICEYDRNACTKQKIEKCCKLGHLVQRNMQNTRILINMLKIKIHHIKRRIGILLCHLRPRSRSWHVRTRKPGPSGLWNFLLFSFETKTKWSFLMLFPFL
jgi:hypothetical protein